MAKVMHIFLNMYTYRLLVSLKKRKKIFNGYDDGTVSLDGHHVAIGGVFRDSNAKWIWGYKMSFGSESIFKG